MIFIGHACLSSQINPPEAINQLAIIDLKDAHVYQMTIITALPPDKSILLHFLYKRFTLATQHIQIQLSTNIKYDCNRYSVNMKQIPIKCHRRSVEMTPWENHIPRREDSLKNVCAHTIP